MKVLVCGGAGYIGSNMTAMLREAGHEPVVYDNLSSGHQKAVKTADFVKGDLADFDMLVKILTYKQIDAVMHFAAFIEVSESVENPLEFYRNNVCNTHTLLAAMEKCNIDKFVFSSSAAVYGTPEKTPITEDAATNPINPYGQTKLAVERMCHCQSQTGRLKYAALRYFNAAGAGADGSLGEDHKLESHLIPLAIEAALGKKDEIKIFGVDYPTDDGTCIRDYIHIEDLCSAHLLALEKLNYENELIYNLGNGKGYSVQQVIETVKKVSGKNFRVVNDLRRAGDPPILTADATKAIEGLGWEVKYPELEAIIETAWKWHSENPNGYAD
ncbi:MAG: UDP-glucose 4-epimerase GalE [Sedimentisphaerales bacterium]|nr:UDP-glucose 4-epimerase GalE [Sedimentisphaerales bacterium]